MFFIIHICIYIYIYIICYIRFAVTLIIQAAAEVEAIDHDNAQAVPMFISGASAAIDGFYDPAQEKGLDGRVLYLKRGDASVLIEHFRGQWQVKALTNKGQNICHAMCAGGSALHSCSSHKWMMFAKKKFVDAPGMKMLSEVEAKLAVSSCSKPSRDQRPLGSQLLALTLHAQAEAIVADNERAELIFISGLAGDWEDFDGDINGFFVPAQEKKKGLDGRVVYFKRGDASVLIEHLGGRWQVKDAKHKGTNKCHASVEGGCALEACTSRDWKVEEEDWTGKSLVNIPGVKMVTGAEAEQKVGCSPRFHYHINLSLGDRWYVL
jgi:hypothetical protein